jgi:2-aminoethylphosphonate-pyruvate transaminase
VHCETTTGILNPIDELGNLAMQSRLTYIVDAMSSFGALPVRAADWNIDFLISSANKCIEGVPGFSFIIASKRALEACRGVARSVSLDLHAQWQGLERDGQFRFTPPTHALLAFHQALRELEEEGGVTGRNKRYTNNHAILLEGMRALGFIPYLKPEQMAPIITSFMYPANAAFQFNLFYEKLSERGFLIYPGKLSQADSFRIGNIGRLFAPDIEALLLAILAVLGEMKVDLNAR